MKTGIQLAIIGRHPIYKITIYDRAKYIKENPVGVRYEDACKVAEWLGFQAKGGRGSHRVFVHPTGMMLNFQNRQGVVLAYQADQLILAIERFEKYRNQSII